MNLALYNAYMYNLRLGTVILHVYKSRVYYCLKTWNTGVPLKLGNMTSLQQTKKYKILPKRVAYIHLLQDMHRLLCTLVINEIA